MQSRLSVNVIWNIIGSILPLVAAIIAVPWVISGLGVERFGILTLIWAVIGYFNLFDLGLGQALTKLVAEKKGRSDETLASLVWTALFMMLILSLLASLLLWVLTPWLVKHLLEIPRYLQTETLQAFYFLGLGLPFVIMTSGLRGVLEACQAFRKINLIRIPLGIFIFIAPLFVLPFSTSLVAIVGLLLIGRVIAWLVYLKFCIQQLPELDHKIEFDKKHVKPLISFGGWMTVSSIIGPMMVYFDRFVIGALVSMAAVAYYVTPYEVVTRLWILPGAVAGVLFPAFASMLNTERARSVSLFDRGQKIVFLLIYPVILILFIFAREGLALWLDPDFSDNSYFVLRCLAVGVLLNCMASIPASLIRAAGRPDLTAKLHLLELPFYILALWYITADYGIKGAALVWTLRIAVDTSVLFYLSNNLLPGIKQVLNRDLFIIGAGLLLLLVTAALDDMKTKLLVVFVAGVLSLIYLWKDIHRHGTFLRRET